MTSQSNIQFMKSPLPSFGRLCTCSAGAVAVVTALVLPVLLSFVSLGTEVGHWYLAEREMQGAADAAVISAAAEYIYKYNNTNGSPGTTYQQVGANYALLNGFTIPTQNVCLMISSGDNCDPVRSLDSRPIICNALPCIAVEITQTTAQWLTTKASLEPGVGNRVQSIPTPTLKARAVVSMKQSLVQQQQRGNDCILALANDPQAVLVHGSPADLIARCGVAIDGGRDQNARTPNINSNPLCSDGTTPPCGGITFNGSHINVTALVLASTNTTATLNCPANDNGAHWQQWGSTQPLTNITRGKATPDPYAASLNFPTGPLGVQTGGVQISFVGSGYGPNGLCTFTVSGGTGTPAQFTATITNGHLDTTKPVTVIDPGAYTVFPSPNPVQATTTTCGGSQKATFNLTEGCFTWNGTPIPGREARSTSITLQ